MINVKTKVFKGDIDAISNEMTDFLKDKIFVSMRVLDDYVMSVILLAYQDRENK